MSARRNTNNRRYWPRSTILYAPMQIEGAVPEVAVSVLTTVAVTHVAPTIHENDKVISMLIVSRVAVGKIQ